MDEKIINQYSDGEGNETPRPERAQASERVSPVIGRKRLDRIVLSEFNNRGMGTSANLEICDGVVDLNIGYVGQYHDTYSSLSIDKEMAIKIIEYLKDYYEI